MKALTGPCRCCERPTTRYARDMAVIGTSGMCPDCWHRKHIQLASGTPGLHGDRLHITDSNTACDSREEVNAKIIAVGGYTIVPDKLLRALLRHIQASPSPSGCMDFHNMLASFLIDGLRLATEQVQALLDALGLDACCRVYALVYSCMLCPWECPLTAPYSESFRRCEYPSGHCNVPWCAFQHSVPMLKHQSLKAKTYSSADASKARPFSACTCGQCPGKDGQY
jgi:hypothetical protein